MEGQAGRAVPLGVPATPKIRVEMSVDFPGGEAHKTNVPERKLVNLNRGKPLEGH